MCMRAVSCNKFVSTLEPQYTNSGCMPCIYMLALFSMQDWEGVSLSVPVARQLSLGLS